MARALKVGDCVRLDIAARKLIASVVEDLGNIGVDGRQLVIVESTATGEPKRFSMPASDLTRMPPTSVEGSMPRLTLEVDDEDSRLARLTVDQQGGATDLYDRDQWGNWTHLHIDAFGVRSPARDVQAAAVAQIASRQEGVHGAMEQRGLLSPEAPQRV